jgi:solute carrier family 25, member 34/35
MATLSTLGGFSAGALAACGAVTVTNPMEVVKTRLQLQGELAAKGQVKKVYTGVFQALRLIAVNEGIKGIPFLLLLISGTQRGLGVAVYPNVFC